MKAAIVEKIGTFQLADIEKPEPGRGEVLIETAVTGLCRTDLKIIEVGHRDLVLPRIPGEEVVGTVCATGPHVAPGIKGRRVYVYPGTCCGACRACRKGAGNLCGDMRIMGFHRDGGFAEYVLAPVESTIPIPDGCTFDDAVIVEPLSCCLNGLERAALAPGEQVGVWGGGPAGALVSRAAKAMGAEATVIEPDERRHRYHKEVLAAPDARCFDVAVVAVGSSQCYRDALAHLAPRGRLVVFSGLPRDDSVQTLDFNELHYGEQCVVGAYGCTYHQSVKAMDWVQTGAVEVRDLISHRMPLAELVRALDHVRNRDGMKILLYPRDVP